MIDHPRSTCELCGLWLGAVARYVSNVCRECRGTGGKRRNQCAWPGCSKPGVVQKSIYFYCRRHDRRGDQLRRSIGKPTGSP